MTKDNDRYARQIELAREYEKKMAARDQSIHEQVREEFQQLQLVSYEQKNLSNLFSKRYNAAFETGKYEKPSQFFQKEMPWIFGKLVYDRFREFRNAYADILTPEQERVFDLYLEDGSRIQKALYMGRYRDKPLEELMIRGLFLLGRI